jgi:hypothetical protein
MTAVIVLLDDVRSFRDGRAHHIFRTSADLVAFLAATPPEIAELWLDYDLLNTDTAQPVVDYLVCRARDGIPVAVHRIWVHSANTREGHRITESLRRAGYAAQRSFHSGLFTRARQENLP